MHFTKTLVGGFTLLSASSSAAFTSSCHSCSWFINKAVAGLMACDCRKIDGSYGRSALELGRCFGNNNGNIQPQQK